MNKIKIAKSSLAKRYITKFAGNRLALGGLIAMSLIIFLCYASPLFTRYDPSAIDGLSVYLPFSADHLFGTDQLGRDVLARILYGGRYSIMIGIFSAVSAQIIGVLLGSVAGYYGGKVDQFLLYCSEIFTCFPSMILIIIVAGLVGNSVFYLILIFAFTGWAGALRMVRSRVLSLREEAYVESCKANGIRGWSIMFRHILPNTLGIIIVGTTNNISGYVLAEAGLSYLGIGVPPALPTWGNMINAAKSLSVMINHPTVWIVPGIVISLFVLSCNFFGDGLRDVFDVSQ